MIDSKSELRRYLEMDASALGVNPKKCYFFGKEIWRFQRSLRMYEYYLNCTSNRVLRLFWHLRYRYWSLKLGFVIPPNVFGGGYGLIIMET